MMKNMKIFYALLVSALCLASIAEETPEYGRGHDVYTSSSAALISGDTLFMIWPSAAHREERFLFAVDVSDPARPKLLDKLAVDGFPADLAIDKSNIYLVNGMDLLAIDASNPASLKPLGTLRVSDSPLHGPQGIAIQNGIAWLACRRGGVKAADIRNPSNPKIVGSVDLPAFTRGLAAAGNLLYVAADTRGVYVLDISTPARPRIVTRVPVPAGCAGRIRLADGHAFLAAGNVLVASLSLADPKQPEWIGATDDRNIMTAYFGSYSHDLAITDSTCPESDKQRTLAVVADGESGMIVSDVSQPDSPRFIGALISQTGGGSPGFLTGLATKENIVYVLNEWSGLLVVDISRPENPAIIGEGLKLTP